LTADPRWKFRLEVDWKSAQARNSVRQVDCQNYC
jgi:hypothetical protein